MDSISSCLLIFLAERPCNCARLSRVITHKDNSCGSSSIECGCREAKISADGFISSDPLKRSIRSRTSDHGLFRKQELETRAVGRLRITDNNTANEILPDDLPGLDSSIGCRVRDIVVSQE
ncbi:unnamed protein product [Lasius platythorax]|uniref:Uncharacterized protein n=1 Tax=Lasius platythorax TaxID=488582 RepID=A0AAV2PDB1_9HYME